MEHKTKLQMVIKQLPVLWPMLENICNLERSSALPQEVTAIVLKFLAIREQTFGDAVPREEHVYYEYEETQELKTMCYPNHPTIRHPNNMKSTRSRIKIYVRKHS